MGGHRAVGGDAHRTDIGVVPARRRVAPGRAAIVGIAGDPAASETPLDPALIENGVPDAVSRTVLRNVTPVGSTSLSTMLLASTGLPPVLVTVSV